MKIVIEVIPHDDQRYPTLGDWWEDEEGVQRIRVSDLGDDDMNLCVAIHELVEAVLCRKAGIAEEDVRAFDEAHLADPDPGSHPAAPYRVQHLHAEEIERLLGYHLKVDWREYEERCGVVGA